MSKKNDQWVTIYRTTNEVVLCAVKAAIEDEGIPAVRMNQRDSSYLAFGEIVLFVPQEAEEKAREIITRLEIAN